jgi:CheY-like chemotaxis protein/metal-responsive CopG/Arc/MetJ family transcriptional regulator
VKPISDYNQEKERISLYVSKDVKEEWQTFAKRNEFSTLSKLIREALKFYIQSRGLDLPSLSHGLKEPLTSIKGYLQLIIETSGDSLDDNVISTLNNVLNQCSILENKVVDYLDKFELETEEVKTDNRIDYDLLLIEDDVETVNLLTSYFDSKGISCKGILSGFKGLKELKKYTPKLVLLDIILPDISGYEILEKMKANDKLKNIPVFFLTAIPSVEVEKKAAELGATGSIMKPFNLSDLDVLSNYLKKK